MDYGRRCNGELFWGNLTGRLINPLDTTEGSIWILDDIDEQKRAVIGHVVCAGKDTPRAEVQRERILCAAQKCFIEHGFHAASMANIAEAAQMSAGLMYRYFENKSAIVRAIVERQLQNGRAQIAQLHTSADLAASLLQTYRLWLARDHRW